jgi:hypothetical protein
MAKRTITLGKPAESDVELDLFGKRYALAQPTRKAVRKVAALQSQIKQMGTDPGDVDEDNVADVMDQQARMFADGVEAMTANSDGLADLIFAEWEKDTIQFPDLMELFNSVGGAFRGEMEHEGND